MNLLKKNSMVESSTKSVKVSANKATSVFLSFFLVALLLFSGCGISYADVNKNAADSSTSSETQANSSFNLNSVPAYSESSSVIVNDNVPFFTAQDLARSEFKEFTPLDSLGRCGAATMIVSPSTMPTGERGSIGMVKPSGWHTIKYDFVDGKYLYNRCHLLGWQLSGENSNELNLITGTRSLNVEGMLPYENRIADYVESTGQKVILRSTPVFEGSNLLASGVLMEAQSVADAGASLEFCVWCYNAEPGVTIDYATGDSQASSDISYSGSSSDDTNAMYRLYNPNSGEHFYTADTNERNAVRAAGWSYEGVGWYAPSSGAAVYRLYNPNAGEHHYTTSVAERDNLINHGWTWEEGGWYSGGDVTVWREYNPNEYANNHNYTTNKGEHDWLLSLGWNDEQVAWYAVKAGEPSTSASNANQGGSSSSSSSGSESASGSSSGSESSSGIVMTYVLNTNTMKFHYSTCRYVSSISAANKKTVDTTRSALIAQGYSPCKVCNP